ncbi:hypothetical protein [Paraburkholderia fynbosensis]|uniref:Lipoprotein n=1 Tax=Paraburkholderia fynbosensis TaxID=1200993 RepID=A0A6J5FXF0_9BURK|nr:hypothetical protein [Paraburkholderia fynbosensis]CAB3786833.1 hypothetical protein LMG27177_02086 [Paraburkholderia fynbosensis]
MKQFAHIALVVGVLAFGVTACQKAHEAGNDSMSTGNSHIEAAAGQSGSGANTPLASAASAVASAVRPAGASQ